MARTRGWRRQWTGPETESPAPEAIARPEAPSPTRIEPDCEIEGHFALDGPLDVEGEFRGSIACGATVEVGASGTVEASIEGREVLIHGAVVGDVTARREIVLHSTARVHGKLTAPSIVIERGAFFQGETCMYRPEHRLQATSPDAPTAAPDA